MPRWPKPLHADPPNVPRTPALNVPRRPITPAERNTYIDTLLNDDTVAEAVAGTLRDSRERGAFRFVNGIIYSGDRALHDLGPVVFRRQLERLRAERARLALLRHTGFALIQEQARTVAEVLAMVTETDPRVNTAGGMGATQRVVGVMGNCSSVPATYYGAYNLAQTAVAPLPTSGTMMPPPPQPTIALPLSALTQADNAFLSLHIIVRIAIIDELHDINTSSILPMITDIMPTNLDPTLRFRYWSVLLLRLSTINPIRETVITHEQQRYAIGSLQPAPPTRAEVERGLLFLDAIEAPRNLLHVYTDVYKIDIRRWGIDEGKSGTEADDE